MTNIARRISESGGDVLLLTASGLGEDHEQAIEDRFVRTRDDEYAQVLKSARKFMDHVERECATHDFRYAEAESLEEELGKVRRQFERVVKRDYLETPTREDAQSALLEAERKLSAYMLRASEADAS